MNPRVVLEAADHGLDVGFERGVPRLVAEDLAARRLHPARVVDVRPRRSLRPGPRLRIPTGIEEHQHHADAVAVGDRQKPVDPVEEAPGVGGVGNVVEEHANRVEAQ